MKFSARGKNKTATKKNQPNKQTKTKQTRTKQEKNHNKQTNIICFRKIRIFNYICTLI